MFFEPRRVQNPGQSSQSIQSGYSDQSNSSHYSDQNLAPQIFTSSQHTPAFQALKWQEISPRIKIINPELAQIIDELAVDTQQDDHYACYLVRYPFGQKILDRGVLQLPNQKNQFLPIHHPDQDPLLQKDLSYIRGMPVGLVLNKSIEMFLSINNRDTPFSLMGPGKIFGLWALLNRDISCERGNMWQITSGARSLFMLPKLTDNASHKRLQRFCGISAPAPQNLADHWEIFKQLTALHGPRENTEWSSELIFFSKPWVEKQAEPLWQALRLFLYRCAWDATAFWRNQFIYDVEFYTALETHNLKPDPYLVDTSKHALALSTGIQTGFGVALNNDAAPISFLQKTYLDIYNLPYAPTIMQPTYIHNAQHQPIYYSLHVPTLGGYSPRGRKLASKKYNLKELQYILQKTLKTFSENSFELQESPVSLYNITKNLSFRYFHTEQDPFGEIEHTQALIHSDSALKNHLAQHPHLEFCDTSLFLCGVIQISKNNHVSNRLD